MLYGVDVSHHQGSVNWPALASAGLQYGICKATEGTGFRDDRFASNVRGCRAAGMVPGAYHYLQPGDGAAQARFFLDAVRGSGVPIAGTLLVVDVERASGGNPSRADAAEFVTEVRRQLGAGRPVGLYTGNWYWSGVIGDPDMTGLRVWLWHSRYVVGDLSWQVVAGKVPASWWEQVIGGQRPSMLQISSTAAVPGVAGRCDLNAYPGSRANLLTLAGVAPAAPEEDPDPMAGLYADQAAFEAAIARVVARQVDGYLSRAVTGKPNTIAADPAGSWATNGIGPRLTAVGATVIAHNAAQTAALSAAIAAATDDPGITPERVTEIVEAAARQAAAETLRGVLDGITFEVRTDVDVPPSAG